MIEIWCLDKSSDKYQKYDWITPEDFKLFRNGHYKDASKKIQTKWKWIARNLIVHVNKRWKLIDVRRATFMRDVISTSDEAIIAWFFHAYSDDWKEKILEKRLNGNGGNVSEQERTEKKKSKERPSRTKIMYYYQYQTRIANCIDPKNTNSTGWDEAIHEEENDEWENSKKGKKRQYEEEEETDDEDGNETKKAKCSLATIVPGYDPTQIFYEPCKPVKLGNN